MSDLNQPIRDLALIGTGYWGKNLARNFNELGALHTLCDANPATLAAYEAGFASVQKTVRYEDVLRNPDITKVAIAAPAAAHFTLVKAALEAGKDIFVEKPLCLDVREGEELVALAKTRERVLMVGHLLQYHPCIQKLQSLIEQGELGKLQYITSNRLNLGKIRHEENALWSFAPHDLSVILSLIGNTMPELVRCTGEAFLSKDVADVTLTTLRFASQVRAHIFVSWLNPFKEQKLTVVGSNGMAVFDDTRPWNEKLILHRHYLTWSGGQTPTPNKNKGEPVVVPESEPLRNECAHFLECCRERRTPRTDGHEGLRVLRVLQMAQRSLETDGEAVSINGGKQKAESRNPTSDTRPLASGGSPSSALRPPSSAAPPSSDFFAHPTAVVDKGAIIGKGTKIWHFSHIMRDAQIGERCSLGQNVNVDGGTVIGNNVKVQNNVSIYTGTVIEDDVFLGPSCVLTNVTNPRSQINRHSLYEKTVIRRGATLGANATIVCGITIGRYAFIGAGAVVTKDVPDYALVIGNPARQKGWMSRHGHLLKPGLDGIMTCPESGLRFQLVQSRASHQQSTTDSACDQSAIRNSQSAIEWSLRCLDLEEEEPLPSEMTVGQSSYRTFKTNTQ